jgi:CHAT domain-containing protein
LANQEKDLRKKINEQETLRQKLRASKAAKEKIAEVEKGIEENLRGWRDVWAKIRLANPKLANFTQPTPLNLAEIQKQILDENSVLLEYFLGAERSFLFVVTKNSLKAIELPKRLEIENLARNFYESLKARAKNIPNESEANRQIRLQKADAERQKSGAALSKMLLAPVAKEIENKRLLVVAAEVLQYLPFSALPTPNSKFQIPNSKSGEQSGISNLESGMKYLIETNEVVNLPSVSALVALRKTNRQPHAKDLAIFADPIFSGDDERLRPASAFRSNFQRLDFTREEAQKIASFAPPEKRLLALDFQASLQNLRSQDLRQYRVLHFATHGTIDPRFPELSGMVLSLVDEKGKSQEGFLRLSEIYNLKLNAKMVVLSACETGLGNFIRGEGLVGFTHAFMYAGTESVVASLWWVDDYATSELMQRFYQAMIKEGFPPAKALQKAQISMIKEKGLNNPFYWSPFTLQGEWR